MEDGEREQRRKGAEEKGSRGEREQRRKGAEEKGRLEDWEFDRDVGMMRSGNDLLTGR